MIQKYKIIILLFILLFQFSVVFAQVVEIYEEEESLWYPLENKKSLFFVYTANNYSFGLRDEISSVIKKSWRTIENHRRIDISWIS